MKFACGEFHLWYQVALSMVACGKVRPRPGVVHHPQEPCSPLLPPRGGDGTQGPEMFVRRLIFISRRVGAWEGHTQTPCGARVHV